MELAFLLNMIIWKFIQIFECISCFFLLMSRASQVVLVVKNAPANAGDIRDVGSIPGSERSPSLRRKWKPTPVFLPRKSHEQRNPTGYSPWDHKELDMTEHAQTHILLFLK